MKNITCTFALASIILGLGIVALAQAPKKAPAYKIAGITITPYDEASGKFEDPITSGDGERSLFNDLSTSLFVTVDIAGEAGSFETGRMINITVKEGKKIKTTRHLQVGLIGGEGHYFVPVWLDSGICSTLTITASLSGQKTSSTAKRTVSANCGE